MAQDLVQLPPYIDPTLTLEDRALLDRHLNGYLMLLDGRARTDTEAREHFVAVARGDSWPVTAHEVAFLKWQIQVGWKHFERPISQPQKGRIRGGLDALTGKAATKAASMSALVSNIAKVPANKAVGQVAVWYNGFLATDAAAQIDRWLRDVFASKATIYDKAMDGVYIDTHQGGNLHRLFDGGHDPVGAWQAVAAASPHDTLTQEVVGYLTALWKDFVTPMGLPAATFDKGYFDTISARASDLIGVSPQWLADAVTLNASEFLGAAVGALAVCMGWSKPEREDFAKLAGSLAISASVAANPILGIVALVCLARAFQTARHGADLRSLLAAIANGGTGTAAFLLACSLISGPIWVTMVAGVLASVAANIAFKRAGKNLAEVEWCRIAEFAVHWMRGGDLTLKTLPVR